LNRGRDSTGVGRREFLFESTFHFGHRGNHSEQIPPLEICAVKLAIKVALVLGQTFIGNPFDPNVTDIR
jgi:hypothetical protein